LTSTPLGVSRSAAGSKGAGSLKSPAGDHHPVPLGQGVGQVLGLASPDIHAQERGVAVASLTVLLDPLGDRHRIFRHGDAVLGEAELGVSPQLS
jgi:hypothetical protein